MSYTTITFADEYRDSILAGEKTITTRWRFEHDLEPGDTLSFVDESGRQFALAETVAHGELRADWVPFADFSGYPRYVTTSDYLEALNQHYPDAGIESGWVVDVIVFQVVRNTTLEGFQTFECEGCGTTIEADSPLVADHPADQCPTGSRHRFVVAREERDPEDDPFACSMCGEPLGSLKRLDAAEYCDGCLREYGFDEESGGDYGVMRPSALGGPHPGTQPDDEEGER